MKYTVLLVTSLTSFLTPFMLSALNVAVPQIAENLKFGAAEITWVQLSFLLATSMFLLPIGKLSDIYGRKKTFLFGLFIFVVTSFFCAQSATKFQLIVFRALQGIGASMIFGTGLAILTSVFPANERGKAIGINVAAVYLGLTLGPFLGGILVKSMGWQSIFMAGFYLGALLIILVLVALKGEWKSSKKEEFDIIGSFIYVISMFCLVYGISQIKNPLNAGFIIAGIFGFIQFIKYEKTVVCPVLQISVFLSNRLFLYSNLAAFITYSATFAVGFLISQHLQYVKGLNPQQTGILLLAQPVFMFVLSPFAGRFSDKKDPIVIASAGMGLTAFAMTGLLFLSYDKSNFILLSALSLMGVGLAMFSSPNTNAVMSSVEKKDYGFASAALATTRLSGQMISMALTLIIFSIFMGSAEISQSNIKAFSISIEVVIIIFILIMIVGTFLSWKRKNMLRQNYD